MGAEKKYKADADADSSAGSSVADSCGLCGGSGWISDTVLRAGTVC
jgi:hypothetical protein